MLDRSIQQEESRLFWKQFHEDIARLRANPSAWAAYESDARDLHETLMYSVDLNDDWSFLAQANPAEIELLAISKRLAILRCGRG